MTTLQFVGDVPLWLGLVAAAIVCFLSWRYYSRESFHLPGRLKWLLPMMRSLAFLLGIMVLTGPVLHHRTTIGELGKVKIYLDASRSMTMHDRHMTTGRKLLIAEQLGWISAGRIDATLLHLADNLASARGQLVDAISENTRQLAGSRPEDSKPPEAVSPDTLAAVLLQARSKFAGQLKALQPQIPGSLTERYTVELLQPLESAVAGVQENTDASQAFLLSLGSVCDSFELAVRNSFEVEVANLLNSGDESLRTALAMFDDLPRWRRAELELSKSSANVLARLREQHDVEVLSLAGETATPLTLTGGTTANGGTTGNGGNTANGSDPTTQADQSTSTITAWSNETDLSSGVVATQKSVLSSSGANAPTLPPRTAVVLITDGQHNSGPSPLQTARVLGGQGLAIYTVSMGASQQAPDLAIVKIEHPDLVFQKDSVRGAVIVRDQMPAGMPFVVQIGYQNEILWQQQLVTQDLPERRVEFEFRIDKLVNRIGAQFTSDIKQHAVPMELEAFITPLAEESETANNQGNMRLAAIVSNYKVLIIDGRSRWETRYLRNVFERDEQWSVNTIVVGPGTDDAALRRGDQEGQFPATRDDLFKYDIVIFGEASVDLFTDQDFQWLSEFVETRGGGMIFVDGQRGLLRQLAIQSFGSLLPVEWLNETVPAKLTSLQLTEKGASEDALKLAAEDIQNRRFWTELPPPHTLVAVQALPGAEVLVEIAVDGKTYPGIVTRAFGAGRVVYFSFDETWRWRYKVADTWHQRLWNQLAKYVMPRPFSVSDEFVSLDTGSVRYDFGDPVDVRVRLLGLDGKPAVGASADALVWKDERIVSTVSLNADPGVPGIYRGRFGSLPEGDYEVSVRASGYSDSALKARSQFVVLPPESGEMTLTAANEPLLSEMAAASGGVSLREEEMYRLPELLSPLSHGRVVESDTLIWQSYWWFMTIVILLTAEWLLRKRAGLL